MGLVWDRQFMHEQVELNQAIADLLLVIKPHLTIVNAVYALVTNGPSGPGKTDELNTVVASADPVAPTRIPWASRAGTTRNSRAPR